MPSVDKLQQAVQALNVIIQGKEDAVAKMLCCFLASGHVLIEDLPGMGKTTLAQSLAKVLGLDYTRVQFTSDLLPADLLGSSIFERQNNRFIFHQGPIFTQLLLADEINRTTPKTQSALLEAMAEKQISIEGESQALDSLFFVIATQNPDSQLGTFALPESQLDRFMLKVSLGYPDEVAERALLKGDSGREKLAQLEAIFTTEDLQQLRQQVKAVVLSEPVLDYVQALIRFTREHKDLSYGISPRGAQALVHMAKAWALYCGRNFVLPDDVQALAKPVFAHRLMLAASSAAEADSIIVNMLQEIAVP